MYKHTSQHVFSYYLGLRPMSSTLGARLREERERLQMSQEQLAAVAGVRKLTQLQYEQDKTSPTAKYLLAVASRGVNLAYVLGMAVPEPQALSSRQKALLDHHANAGTEGQRAIERLAMLEAQQAGVKKTGKRERKAA
jgi:transcriptional regulator with XRE-family HTH domain